MRLILFDIDGTLLTTNGAAKRAFHRALLEIYGTAGPIESYEFHGRTDPRIARDLLRSAGFDDLTIDQAADAFWARYARNLAAELHQPAHRTTALPGVFALLDALSGRTDAAVLGLLTGNIRPGAVLKLESAGLGGRFGFGAFGSDDERREALPAIAVRRAYEETGLRFTGAEVVIVGDTPHDVTCGQALGVRAVGVATGRHHADELREAGAAAVLGDFSETDAAVACLLGEG